MKIVCSWCRKEGSRWQASAGTTSVFTAASTLALLRWTGLLNLTKKIRQ
jgi:hypothetical protein